jgi:Helix-turn-helix domain
VNSNRSNPKAQKKKQKRLDSASDRVKRAAWAKTLRRIHPIAAKASGMACKVFMALQFHADMDGYCWPLIATLGKFTGIKKRDTIFAALRELDTLGIVDRGQLISRRGRNSPTLYRIGGKVEELPANAAARYYLGPSRAKKSGRRPAKRDLGARGGRGPAERDLASVPAANYGRKHREAAQNTVPGLQNRGEVPFGGTTGVPSNGTQNYSREQPADAVAFGSVGGVGSVEASLEVGALDRRHPPLAENAKPDDDDGERIPNPSTNQESNPADPVASGSQIDNLKATALLRFKAKHKDIYDPVFAIAVLDLIEARALAKGTQIASASYFVAGLENEFNQREGEESERIQSPSKDSDPRTDLVAHCASCIALFDAAAKKHPSIARALRKIAGTFQDCVRRACDAPGLPDLDALEKEITPLDAQVFLLLQSEERNELVRRIRREMQGQLKMYAKNMSAEHLAIVEAQYVQRMILEAFELPRLSLFYMGLAPQRQGSTRVN